MSLSEQNCVQRSLGILILMLVAGTGSASEWQERITRLKNAELRTLQSCVPPASCPVFFISALGGAFPIPTRYLLVEGPGSRELTFTSPAGILPGPVTDYLVGIITIGSRAELESKRASGEITLEPVTEMDNVSVFKLQPIDPSGAASEFRRETFVLVGGKEYVLIADQNAELAQALLQFRLRARSWKK